MPLFYQHNINEKTRLGIWKIEEPEIFFLKKVPLKKDVSHPHKRLQHLAGRYLLPFLFDDFPIEEIVIADTKKPFLENEKYHFSISHCGNFAAAIVSSKSRVGVDIEIISDKVGKIRHKFLSDNEYSLIEGRWPMASSVESSFEEQKFLTSLWSSKEAIFKWYSLGNIDFKAHMQLREPMISVNENEWLLPFVFLKSNPINLPIHIKYFQELVLAWVIT
ncbi:MAG TPA: 4'-phosphopantetheinyl transferase superfamily protein [Puia sp.]|nr:4'-phosphopantetheinyl transferase superfamily protein [Puia sp.]